MKTKEVDYPLNKRVVLTRNVDKTNRRISKKDSLKVTQYDENMINDLIEGSQVIRSFLWTIHCEIRVMILKELLKRPQNVKEISQELGELHSVISFHLKHLRNHKMVDFDQHGKVRIYKLSSSLGQFFQPIVRLNELMK